MMDLIQLLGINLNPVVQITRNLYFEESVKQAGQIVVRRNTCDSGNTPFRGRPREPIRGRKRTTLNIVVRSIQPNVDARTLAMSPCVDAPPPSTARAPLLRGLQLTQTTPTLPKKKHRTVEISSSNYVSAAITTCCSPPIVFVTAISVIFAINIIFFAIASTN